jgi:2-polyprenyl-6-hydroxyphenyl methylase/3-demethylubiquinone-9 3-methyltransferase
MGRAFSGFTLFPVCANGCSVWIFSLPNHILELYMERRKDKINNDFYETLNDEWVHAHDHPVALLRAENALRTPWIIELLRKKLNPGCKLLDLGCGAGFLTNVLAQEGYQVTGVDISASSLNVARNEDATQGVDYLQGDVHELPFADESFDAVSALDLLEHVGEPKQVIKEAARVLKPGGLFFFHTFNRNFLSWLTVIKGVEWFVSNAPKHMHVYSLFITPAELREMCASHGLIVEEITGVRPDYKHKAFWQMLLTGAVSDKFRFVFTPSQSTGYLGYARKKD